ncbi:hypothetical protein [Shewanella surugensis]|uniref:Uncharacterized protein n=1 Tax=Shewanella surugensis TaxID=212020 RepID=A0ABT0LKB1_9GAMM|nr:hypothetical protein [Shewanella surugensis]MCL1127581.1 hypothetical protein [Shewanella surugensis]
MVAIIIVVVLVLIGFYFYFMRVEVIEKCIYIAISMMALYLVAYWVFAPNEVTSSRRAYLFEVIPAVSFVAILYPQFNRFCRKLR